VKIPLGVFGEGRLTLPPGRKGEIIPVHEDELSTIIAYSLVTDEYYVKLQEFLGGEVDPDFEYNATHDGGWGAPYAGSRGERTSDSTASRTASPRGKALEPPVNKDFLGRGAAVSIGANGVSPTTGEIYIHMYVRIYVCVYLCITCIITSNASQMHS
jgi:hypothetical protein